MITLRRSQASERQLLLARLHRRYARGTTLASVGLRLQQMAWKFRVSGPVLVKRNMDVLVSLTMLTLLLPLFATVAVLIKRTDGGPALFWQRRVGRWGREFWFPKFRSMVMNAEQLKDQLLKQNDHKDGVTFKMKRDPRV